MSRLLARLGMLTLSAVALTGCASSTPAATAQQTAAAAIPTDRGPVTDLNGEIAKAQAARLSGDYGGAIHVLSQLMLVAPDDARVVGEYGKVLAQQGRAKEALDFLHRAVELRSNDWTLYSALGVAYDQVKDYNSARLSYERALALKPGEAAVLNNYAMSRMLAGDLAQAHSLIAQASISSTDPKIQHNMALIASLAPTPAVASTAAPVMPVSKPSALPTAQHTPKPLVATSTPQTIMMQALPFDPKAGPVSKRASHEPRKLAAKPVKTTPATAANGIPALRLANDRP